MEPLSIRELAQQNEVDENRLYYVFRKYAGMGAGQYLTTHRLNRSREILEDGRVPISEVAKGVGYSDPLYFSRAFRKRFGSSPSSARRIQE
jgi:AraC-like DNA-binding protein